MKQQTNLLIDEEDFKAICLKQLSLRKTISKIEYSSALTVSDWRPKIH